MQHGARFDDAEFSALVAEQASRVRATFGDLPLWAVAGWTQERFVSEWIFEGGPHCLAFAADGAALGAEPAITTRTCLGDPRQDIAGLLAREAVAAGDAPSPALLRVDLLPAPSRIAEIVVDGVREPFEVWEAPGVTRAAASVRGHALTVDCRGVPLDTIELAEVEDIEPFVAGRLAMLEASRG